MSLEKLSNRLLKVETSPASFATSRPFVTIPSTREPVSVRLIPPTLSITSPAKLFVKLLAAFVIVSELNELLPDAAPTTASPTLEVILSVIPSKVPPVISPKILLEVVSPRMDVIEFEPNDIPLMLDASVDVIPELPVSAPAIELDPRTPPSALLAKSPPREDKLGDSPWMIPRPASAAVPTTAEAIVGGTAPPVMAETYIPAPDTARSPRPLSRTFSAVPAKSPLNRSVPSFINPSVREVAVSSPVRPPKRSDDNGFVTVSGVIVVNEGAVNPVTNISCPCD